jgi:cell division protein FtsL
MYALKISVLKIIVVYNFIKLLGVAMNNQINDLKFEISELQKSISALDDEVNRLSCMEQAVKIVLNGKRH